MVKISLCMIVKNEEQVLGRCLESVQGLVDEIIIVDTGSEDRTVEIARQYTPYVYEIPWRDDFAQARNFSFSKATGDYCMWLDADDVISEENRRKFIKEKENMDGTEDMVMMRYVTGFHNDGTEMFSFFRERILKRERKFQWKGRVHEAIVPEGKVVYWETAVFHRKEKQKESGRNLRIYEKMKEEGEPFGPRDLFYYGRELMYNGKYQEAEAVLEEFLGRKDGWVENKIEACMNLSECLRKEGMADQIIRALLRTLEYDVPRAQVCCAIGGAFMDRKEWEQAAFWYEEALRAKRKDKDGGFVPEECYGYLPEIQLCVCYAQMGDEEKAYQHHLEAKKLRPKSEAVLYNDGYFAGRGRRT